MSGKKEQLVKKQHRQEQCTRERNKAVPEPADDPLPDGYPIYDDESRDDDSFVEYTHTQSEGYLFDDIAPVAPSTPFPPEAPNIAPEGATVPPNTYPGEANASPEEDNSRNPICNRDNNNRLKGLKLNRELYALTCVRHH